MAEIIVDGSVAQACSSYIGPVPNGTVVFNTGGQNTTYVANALFAPILNAICYAVRSAGNGQMFANGGGCHPGGGSNQTGRVTEIVPGPIANLELGFQIGQASYANRFARSFPPVLVSRTQ